MRVPAPSRRHHDQGVVAGHRAEHVGAGRTGRAPSRRRAPSPAGCAARRGCPIARPRRPTRRGPAAGGRSGPAARSGSSGIAYTDSPSPARTWIAPRSARSRDTVACVERTPSAPSRSTSCSWLATACCASSLAITCCRRCLPVRGPAARPLSTVRAHASASADEERQRAAGGVHPVGGLHEDPAARALERVGGDLLAPVGGQAVQQDGPLPGPFEQRGRRRRSPRRPAGAPRPRPPGPSRTRRRSRRRRRPSRPRRRTT